jgi:type IV pilus assembly protein PilO
MNLKLDKLPWYGQVGLFVAIALGGVAAFYYLYAVPTVAEMDTRLQRLAALRADIAKGATTANRLNEFKERVARQEAELEELKSRLPEQKDVADLLRRIQTLAAQSDLAIRSFKPAPSVTKQLHAEWPIALQLEGTYHRLGEFLDRISKFPRIINISNITIKARERTESSATITIDCVATTFVLLDQSKPAEKAN